MRSSIRTWLILPHIFASQMEPHSTSSSHQDGGLEVGVTLNEATALAGLVGPSHTHNVPGCPPTSSRSRLVIDSGGFECQMR